MDCYNDSRCGLDNRSGGPLAGRYWVGLGQSSGFPLALWATLTIWPWMASGAAGREKLDKATQGVGYPAQWTRRAACIYIPQPGASK